MRRDPNVEMLMLVAERLGDLLEEVVFLGGCATGLLITDEAAPPIRRTEDVDVIVEVSTLNEYHDLIDRLRNRGFREDWREDAPICRLRCSSLTIDVMPTDPRILGFGSRWFEGAVRTAEKVRLPNGMNVRVVSAPFFLAMKLEAFRKRGGGDFWSSRDLEDLIAVIDGRPSIVDEVSASEDDLRIHLAEEMRRLLDDEEFLYALPGHLPGGEANQSRVSVIRERMARMVSLRPSVQSERGLPDRSG